MFDFFRESDKILTLLMSFGFSSHGQSLQAHIEIEPL